MKKRSDLELKRVFGLFLIFGWIAVILYSSYRVEMGLTEIGHGFLQFLKRILQQMEFSQSWDLNWMEDALHTIVHFEAYILLGVFAGAAMTWWGIKGRSRMILVMILGITIALVDEGYQWLALTGTWSSLDLLWELISVAAGLKIGDFVTYSNR